MEDFDPKQVAHKLEQLGQATMKEGPKHFESENGLVAALTDLNKHTRGEIEAVRKQMHDDGGIFKGTPFTHLDVSDGHVVGMWIHKSLSSPTEKYRGEQLSIENGAWNAFKQVNLKVTETSKLVNGVWKNTDFEVREAETLRAIGKEFFNPATKADAERHWREECEKIKERGGDFERIGTFMEDKNYRRDALPNVTLELHDGMPEKIHIRASKLNFSGDHDMEVVASPSQNTVEIKQP
jgi:hypothetical protein